MEPQGVARTDTRYLRYVCLVRECMQRVACVLREQVHSMCAMPLYAYTPPANWADVFSMPLA